MASAGQRWTSRLETTIVLAAIVLLPLVLVEAASQTFLWLSPSGERVNQWVHLMGRPPAYEHADYFSEALVQEAMDCLRRVPGRGFEFEDFDGEYINVKSGVRQTTDQPEHYAHRVGVFGASSVFSRRVPDRETIPSHLQRLLNARRDEGWLVTNHGLPGLGLKPVVSMISGTSIEPGDVLIAYGGIGEVLGPVFGGQFAATLRASRAETMGELFKKSQEGRQTLREALKGRLAVTASERKPSGSDRPRRESVEDERGPEMVRKMNFLQRAVRQFRIATRDLSAAVRILDDLQSPSGGKDVEREEDLQDILEESARSYRGLLVEAHLDVEARGGQFYNFLQPNLLIATNRSSHEQWLVDQILLTIPGFERAMHVGYEMLADAMVSAATEGVVSINATGVFHDRLPGSEVYFDYAHVNHAGNEMMALRIYNEIFKIGPRARDVDGPSG